MLDCWWTHVEYGIRIQDCHFHRRLDDKGRARLENGGRGVGSSAAGRAFPPMALAAGRQGQGAELAATFRLRLRFSTILTHPVSKTATFAMRQSNIATVAAQSRSRRTSCSASVWRAVVSIKIPDQLRWLRDR